MHAGYESRPPHNEECVASGKPSLCSCSPAAQAEFWAICDDEVELSAYTGKWMAFFRVSRRAVISRNVARARARLCVCVCFCVFFIPFVSR